MESVSAASSSSTIKMDYLNLLVTQLKNQNPLEPMDNSEMTSQLAQISQLEQLENTNACFRQVLALAQSGYASSLIGKDVTFNADGPASPPGGYVSGMAMNDGEPMLAVGDLLVPLEAVQAIREPGVQKAMA